MSKKSNSSSAAMPPLGSSDSDDEIIDQEASFSTSPSKSKPTKSSAAATTPSNTPVVSLFSKVPSNAPKRAFEGNQQQPTAEAAKMLSALNMGNNDEDDDEDDDQDEDNDDQEDDEEEDDFEHTADIQVVQAALPALKQNQDELDELEKKYTLARRDLEIQFQQLRKPFYDARAQLASTEKLPGFWLDTMSRNRLLAQFVEEWDVPCLMFLENVTCEEIASTSEEKEFGYVLSFYFAENNPYFENRVLTKRVVVVNHYPMDGSQYPDVETLEGTEIEWKANQNLTVRVEVKKEVKRAGRRGKRGPPQEIRMQVPQESFFTFFDTPQDLNEEDLQEMEDEEQEAVQQKWESDFAIASTFRSKIIPRALEWYVGEASESEYDDDDDEEDEDEDEEGYGGPRFEQLEDDDDEDEDEESEESEEKPSKKKGGKKSGGASKNSATGEEQKPECNQQ